MLQGVVMQPVLRQRLRSLMATRMIWAVGDRESCVRDADIVVGPSRLNEPTQLLKTAWLKPSALVIAYGTLSGLELSQTDIMDKVVIDH